MQNWYQGFNMNFRFGRWLERQLNLNYYFFLVQVRDTWEFARAPPPAPSRKIVVSKDVAPLVKHYAVD